MSTSAPEKPKSDRGKTAVHQSMEGFGGIPMPYAEDAERGLLCGMINGAPDGVVQAMQVIDPDDLYHPGHRAIFHALVGMVDEGKQIDLITLADALRARDTYEAAGGQSYLIDIYTDGAHAKHIDHYAEIVSEKARRRACIAAGHRLVAMGFDQSKPLVEVLEASQAALDERRQSEGGGTMRRLADYMDEVIEEIEAVYAKRGNVTLGLSTGFTELDRMTMGLRPGSLFIIGARSSHGKSLLLSQILEHIAFVEKKPVAYLTIEDSGKSVAKRLLTRRGGIQIYRLRDGMLKKNDLARLSNEVLEITKTPFFLDDASGITWRDIQTRVRLLKSQCPDLAAVGVDYLQLVRGVSARAAANRQQEVAEVTSGLKALAKELGIVLLTPAQLKREADDYETPRVKHLREAQDIENDADYILLLSRPARRKKNDDEPDDHALVALDKQKDGPVGDFKLGFAKDLPAFTNPLGEDGREKKLYN